MRYPIRYDRARGCMVDADGVPQASASGPLPEGFGAPHITSDIEGYRSMASGKWVDGRAARRDDLARTECREVDPSEHPLKEDVRADFESRGQRVPKDLIA